MPGLPAGRVRAAPTACSSCARLLGGLSAGMAYPTTLALITALWSGPADQVDRVVVGDRRRDLRARAARGGRAARALLVGLGLPRHPAAWPRSRWCWRSRCVPAHVNETAEPVDNLGGILSVVLVGRARARDQLRGGAQQGRARDRAGGDRARRRRRVRASASGGPRTRSTTSTSPAGASFWVAACAGHHRVRLADGRDVHRAAVPAERARLLDARGRCRRSCRPPSAW